MKDRVTVSLPAGLLREAERAGRRRGARTRSAVVEHALVLLVRDSQARDIDASLDAYYGARTRAEQTQEERMVRAFNRSQRRHDLDEEGR